MNAEFLNVAIATFTISDLQNNTAYITVRYADKIPTPNFTCPAKVAVISRQPMELFARPQFRYFTFYRNVVTISHPT